MSKKIKNKIIESDDSMIEQSDTESTKTSSKCIQKSKKRPIEYDSDYSSKSSFESRNKEINKIKVVQTEDEESFNEESYTDDEDFDTKKKTKHRHNSKKIKRVNESSRTRKIKTSHKKDDWNDDESKDESMSSCDPESDNDKSEKNQKITTNQDDEIVEFLNSVTVDQIKSLSNISDTKIENFIKLRPFKDSSDMEIRLKQSYNFNSFYYSMVANFNARKIVNQLLDKCKGISKDIKRNIEEITNLKNYENNSASNLDIKEKPENLSEKMNLKTFQLIGFNWLCFMYENKLNAILADEMGLGKTCQSIAFLAYVCQKKKNSANVIIVPSSTLENWSREIDNWFPDCNYIIYSGTQEERRILRKRILSSKNKANVILSSYSSALSSEHDRNLFRKINFECSIFDEAHMLKNMNTQRYEHLMKIRTKFKLSLTGTPLQNNIIELMSLLNFVMPDFFRNKKDLLKKAFFNNAKDQKSDSFYDEKVEQARGIMLPFIFRRTKDEVLKELPNKIHDVILSDMTEYQKEEYNKLLESYKKKKTDPNNTTGIHYMAMLLELRKAAIHPLARRTLYTDEKIRSMAKIIMAESDSDTRYDYVVEDMEIMNDFELHRLCFLYKGLKGFELSENDILNSGKFIAIRKILEECQKAGDKCLIFSQFKFILDIIEEFLNIIGHQFLRLDGSTHVSERQDLIDQFNDEKNIRVFLLTTRAGGVGINLMGANRVILNDIDYNPHNDKQAEDRSHRLGQKKEVKVYRLISKDSIEENILRCQANKLELEANINSTANELESTSRSEIIRMVKELLN